MVVYKFCLLLPKEIKNASCHSLGNNIEGLTKANRKHQAEKKRTVGHGSTKENFEYVDLNNSKIPSFKETDLKFDISSFRPLSFATF